MTGRGIDQVLPHPCDPRLHEPSIDDARRYVELAEKVNGPIPAPVTPDYVWGDAIDELARRRPDARIANLETSITRSESYAPQKEVHYRMAPENAGCLAAAGLDVCCLANNHAIDWGTAGLLDTLAALDRLHIRRAGAGRSLEEAESPAIVDLGNESRILVFATGAPTAGVSPAWAASADRPGVNLLRDVSQASLDRIHQVMERWRRPGDVVVLSIHWGPNWGHAVSTGELAFAHRLIDEVGIDVIHGHSSHHVKAIEVYRGRAMLYGCGDFLTDYEGIGGHAAYRGELGLMYFLTLSPATREIERLEMVPTQMRRFRVARAGEAAAHWLSDVLDREGRRFGTSVRRGRGGQLELCWSGAPR